MRKRIGGIICAGIGIGLSGCASTAEPRYVYQDHESGVVAIASNTPKQMAEAVRLMEKHFPNGNYEIVRAIEINDGKRTLEEIDNRSADLEPRSDLDFIKLGKWHRDHNMKHSDELTLKECRVVYKKKDAGVPASLAFSPSAKFLPEDYSDPVSIGAPPRPEMAKADSPKKDEAKVAKAEGSPKADKVMKAGFEIEHPPLPK